MKVIDIYNKNPQLLVDYIYSLIQQTMRQFYPEYIQFPKTNIEALKYRIYKHLIEQIEHEE